MINITKNYSNIINQIKSFNNKFSKTSKNPQLIAVSKTFPIERITPVIQLGQRVFGENKVQEAHEKWKEIKKNYEDLELHLIGPLQSNKVKIALEIFDVIQTIDREKIVRKIMDQIASNGIKKKFKFLAQVNIGQESQKSGLQITEVKDFVKWCQKDMKINLTGLMCIPPVDEEPSIFFNLLRNLCDENNLKDASMGMSSDFDKAIQFGSTFIRIGSGIFGPRN